MIHPKKMIVMLGVSALMMTPFAPVTAIFGDDAAYAGNGNGNSGGGGNAGGGNKGGGNKGGEKSSSAGNKAGGNGKPVASSAKPNAAKPKAQITATEDEPITFAARDLGNMNGALNANMNAVMAHLRNGKTNGPVGALAGLMAADAALGELDAEEVLARAEAWEAHDAQVVAALGEGGSLDAYLADRAAEETYLDWKARSDAYDLSLADLDPANDLPDPGPEPLNPDFTAIAELETLLANPPEGDAPDDGELAAVDAVTDAEQAVLALWNKNPDATDEISDEEQALLDALRARYSDADLAAIAEGSGS